MNIKRLSWSTVVVCSWLLLGCTNQPTNSQIEPPMPCNRDLQVTHSVTIYTDSADKKVADPQVTQTCTPTIYPDQTEFEKENRRKR